VASRTQIVCLCEGRKGESIDEVFINRLMKSLQPDWLRPWPGSNVVRLVPCGGRMEVVEKMPVELQRCLDAGGNTTLMVWADCDDNCDDGDALKAHFWQEAKQAADAAKKLADFCKSGKPVNNMPPSLQWSCKNWRALTERMR
jgi:hypothetical protein